MGAILPRGLFVPAEAQPGLMHQGGGLKRLAGWFARHLPRGNPAQLVVHQRQKLVSRLRVPSLHLLEDKREITHEVRNIPQPGTNKARNFPRGE
jgi:hypothetical protein